MKFQTYVLSLKDEKQRRHQINKQLNKLNIPFCFFDAVDLRDQPEGKLSNLYSQEKSLENINRPLTKGEIGCSLSHLSIYKNFLKSDKDWALIIEDDAILDRLNLKTIDEICSHSNTYESIILGYSKVDINEEKSYYWRFPIKKKVTLENNILGFPASQWACGTVAYLINKSGAKKILNKFSKNNNLITTVADDWNYLEKVCNLHILHCRPLMVFENFMELESALENDRSQKLSPQKKGLFITIARHVKGLNRRINLWFKYK